MLTSPDLYVSGFGSSGLFFLDAYSYSLPAHRNLQDSNLRPLPLSVKRRIPPRPRFRMPPSFRGVSSLAFGAHCLMPVKGDVAAWRARPSGPDVWADALVRRMYPGKRRGLGGKRKSEAGAQGHTLPHSHCRIVLILCAPYVVKAKSFFTI